MSGEKEGIRILQPCHQVAEQENMVWVCDGAANVGQIGHEIGVLLTNLGKARMCCTTAVAAGSKPHLDIAGRAKRNIVINGCGNKCASKVLENAGRKDRLRDRYIQVPTEDTDSRHMRGGCSENSTDNC